MTDCFLRGSSSLEEVQELQLSKIWLEHRFDFPHVSPHSIQGKTARSAMRHGQCLTASACGVQATATRVLQLASPRKRRTRSSAGSANSFHNKSPRVRGLCFYTGTNDTKRLLFPDRSAWKSPIENTAGPVLLMQSTGNRHLPDCMGKCAGSSMHKSLNVLGSISSF